MPTLLACLSTGKGTWSEVTKIISSQPWSKIFLITNQFGKDNFTVKDQNTTLVVVDPFQEPALLAENIRKELSGKISDFEIALNFCSGSGKEHMALMEAVLELGLNFRLITVNNGQVDTMGIKR